MAGPGAASDTEKLFLLRKWSLAGGHPSPGPSLQQPSCGRTASRRPVAGLGWGPCPQMCSSSCAHPWRGPEPPGGAGRPVGVPLWKGLRGSERAEVVEEGRQCACAGPWPPVPLHGFKRVPHGGEHLRSVCLPDPDLWPLGGCWLSNRRQGHLGAHRQDPNIATHERMTEQVPNFLTHKVEVRSCPVGSR